MPEIILPPPLAPGARLGVYTPAFPGPALFPDRAVRGAQALERLGFEVVMPPAAARIEGYVSGAAQDRAAALMELFEDDSIDGIVCSIGGFNSNAVLPWLDYDSIARHPKVFVGYSDVTALLLALHARTGLVTFHGPALMPEWGEFPEPLEYTARSFLAVTAEWAGRYEMPADWTDEYLDWSKALDCRPRIRAPHAGWRGIRDGRAEGRLLGGNVETLNMLVGTPYCPSYEDSILFLEATEAEAYLPRIDRALTHLETAGLLGGVKGLLIARCPDARPERGVELHDLCRRLGERHGIPVAGDLDFGHTDPKMTLPIGVRAELLCDGSEVGLRLLEPATRRT